MEQKVFDFAQAQAPSPQDSKGIPELTISYEYQEYSPLNSEDEDQDHSEEGDLIIKMESIANLFTMIVSNYKSKSGTLPPKPKSVDLPIKLCFKCQANLDSALEKPVFSNSLPHPNHILSNL